MQIRRITLSDAVPLLQRYRRGAEAELALRELTAHPSVRRVFLFGSVAEGTSRDTSDLDVMIELQPAGNWDHLFRSFRERYGPWLSLLRYQSDAETWLPRRALELTSMP